MRSSGSLATHRAPRVLDGHDGEPIGGRERALEHADHGERLPVEGQRGTHAEPVPGRERRAEHRHPPIAIAQGAPRLDRQADGNDRFGMGTARSRPRISSWVKVMNWETDAFKGSITWACTAATPGTAPMARMLAEGSIPPP